MMHWSPLVSLVVRMVVPSSDSHSITIVELEECFLIWLSLLQNIISISTFSSGYKAISSNLIV